MAEQTCVGCGAPLEEGAVLCIQCGMNQKTGKRLAPQRSTRFEDPRKSPPPPPERTPAWRKILRYWPWLVVLVAAWLGFQNRERILGLFKSAPPPEAAVPEAPLELAPPARAHTDALLGLLDRIKAAPGNSAHAAELLQYVRAADAKLNPPELLTGMKVVYGLSQVGQNNDQVGRQALDAARQGGAGPALLAMAEYDAYWDVCASCKGAKQLSKPCPLCRGSAKCGACGGAGFTVVEKKRDQLGGPSRSRVQSMGAATERKEIKCGACGGTGRCPECRGAGTLSEPCPSCGGAGGALNKGRILEAMVKAIDRTRDLLNRETADFAMTEALRKPEPAEAAVDPASITLFDAVVLFAQRQGGALSADPDAMAALAGRRMPVSELTGLVTPADLKGQLEQGGLAVRDCPVYLRSTRFIPIVTTPGVWRYGSACYLLNHDRFADAVRTLEGPGEARDGGLSLRLKGRLAEVSVAVAPAAALLKETEAAVAALEASRKGAAPAPRLQGLDKAGVRPMGAEGSDSAQDAAAVREREAREALRRAAVRLDECRGRLVPVFEKMARYANEARLDGRRSEALFWLTWMAGQHDLLAKTAGMLRGLEGLRPAGTGAFPEDLKLLREALAQDVRTSLESLAGLDRANLAYAGADLRLVEEALTLDPDNTFARAHAGLITVRRQAADGAALAGAKPLEGEAFQAMVADLKKAGKDGLLRALKEVTGKEIPVGEAEAISNRAVVGRATVIGRQGVVIPLTVKAGPRERKAAPASDSQAMFGFYEETRQLLATGNEIQFGEFGGKDLFTGLTAVEVLKWLRVGAAKELGGRKLTIDFEALSGGKAGEAAGAAMAAAAWSSLFNAPLRQDAVLLGSVGEDGLLRAVPGLPGRIAGAAAAGGVELAVVPKAAGGDLYRVPFADLCRVVILEAERVDEAAQIVRNMQDDWRTTQEIQALVLAGRYPEAEARLLVVVPEQPNNFTARRLLDILTHYRAHDEAK